MFDTIDLKTLPATMTAKQIRQHLWKCSNETLRMAFQNGKIKGRRINTRRTLYDTQSVLEFIGLAASSGPQEPVSVPGNVKLAAGKKKAAKLVPDDSY